MSERLSRPLIDKERSSILVALRASLFPLSSALAPSALTAFPSFTEFFLGRLAARCVFLDPCRSSSTLCSLLRLGSLLAIWPLPTR